MAEELKDKQPRGKKYVPRHQDGSAKPPAKSRTFQKLQAEGDLLDVWERRVLNPLVGGGNAKPITITTPGMKLRWINLAQPGRYQRARYEQGWQPVHKDELVDEREIYGIAYTKEGWVCRGERQQVMLMKMPLVVWKEIQKRKSEEIQKSYKKLKQNLASAGSQHFGDKYNTTAGDQAAEAVGKFKGNIAFGTEAHTSDEMIEEN